MRVVDGVGGLLHGTTQGRGWGTGNLMDSRGHIKPLEEFPDDKRTEARERLEKFQQEHREKLEATLTPEFLAKLDEAEAEFERKLFEGEDEERNDG